MRRVQATFQSSATKRWSNRRSLVLQPSAAVIAPAESSTASAAAASALSLVKSVPALSPTSRVIVAGASTAARLIPPLQQRGVQDILVVDGSAAALSQLAQQHAAAISVLGNELGVRTYEAAELVSLPAYLGPVEAIFLSSQYNTSAPHHTEAIASRTFASESSSAAQTSTAHAETKAAVDAEAASAAPVAAAAAAAAAAQTALESNMRKACLMLRPGAHLVVVGSNSDLAANLDPRSGSLDSAGPGSGESNGRQSEEEEQLPPLQMLQAPFARPTVCGGGLPLQVVGERASGQLHGALLQVPPKFAFPEAPLRLEGRVVRGFGRGSKQLGHPTANIDPAPLMKTLQGLPMGVYFGWAQLTPGPGAPHEDGLVHKMVMNIGKRPTVGEDLNLSIEAYIMHKFGEDFYGRHLRVLGLGFIRPEMRFTGLPTLLARIKEDCALSSIQLDDKELQQLATNAGSGGYFRA